MLLAPELLHHVLSFHRQSTPLAVAASHPTCRLACERRGVCRPSEAAVLAGLEDRNCFSPSTAAKLSTDSYDEGERLKRARQNCVISTWLLAPLMTGETYRRLQHSFAGLRIGHSVSFLVPLSNDRSRGTTTGSEEGAERIRQWELKKYYQHDKGGSYVEHAENRAEVSQLRGCSAQNAGSADTPARPLEGVVRVVVLLGSEAANRKLVPCSFEDTSESESDDTASVGPTGVFTGLTAPNTKTSTPGPVATSTVQLTQTPTSNWNDAAGEEANQPQQPGSRRWTLTQPDNNVDATLITSRTPSSESHSHVLHNAEEMENLFDDWELEAAAAEAAEEATQETKLRRRESPETRRKAGTPKKTTAILKPAVTAVPPDFRTSASLSASPPIAVRRHTNQPRERLPPLPADFPPPSAWWLNRPIGNQRTRKEPRINKEKGSDAARQRSTEQKGEECLAGLEETTVSASLCVVPLCVHARYIFPRWLDWLATEVSPAVLLGLSLCQWPLIGSTLRPFSHIKWNQGGGTLQQESGEEDAPPVAFPRRYYLPLRGFYHEGASPTTLRRVVRVIAEDGYLEHLELPYFLNAHFTADKDCQRSSRKLFSLGRLLSSLRRLNVSQGSLTDSGLMGLLSSIAAARGSEANSNSTGLLPTDLVELVLGGCRELSQLTFCALTPALGCLDMQRTAVTDDSLRALTRPGFSAAALPGCCCEINCLDDDPQDDLPHPTATWLFSSSTVLVMRTLVELKLCRCSVDTGLATLPVCFPNLRRLDLRSSAVSEAGLRTLSSSCRQTSAANGGAVETGLACLEWIGLAECARLESLRPLWSLSALQVVVAPNCPVLAEVGFEDMGGARRFLEQDTAADLPSGADLARSLSCNLMELRLQGNRLIRSTSLGALICHFAHWTLTSLTLDDTSISDQALTLLCGLSSDTRSRPPADDSIVACDALAYISVKNCGGLRSLSALGSLPSLRVLAAANCGVVDSGLRGLARSSSLQEIDLSGAIVADITPLAYVSSLRFLQLRKMPRLTDDSLLRFVFAPPPMPPGEHTFSTADEASAAVFDATASSSKKGSSRATVRSRAGVVAAQVEVIDLLGCSNIRLVGCLAFLPSLRSLFLDSTNIFDTSLYAFFASKQALLTWRHHESGVNQRIGAVGEIAADAIIAMANDNGLQQWREGRQQHEEGEVARTRGATLAARGGTQQHQVATNDLIALSVAERIPDLEELRFRLFSDPERFLSVAGAAHLSEVTLCGCAGVRSIEPLGLLPQLRHLCVDATAVDSAALKGFAFFHLATMLSVFQQQGQPPCGTLGLCSLSLRQCRYVEDLGCLSLLPTLRTLDAGYTAVDEESLTLLVGGQHLYRDELQQFMCSSSKSMNAESSLQHREKWTAALRASSLTASQLTSLNLSGCSQVGSVSSLMGLPALEDLWLLELPHTMDDDVIESLRDSGVRVHQ